MVTSKKPKSIKQSKPVPALEVSADPGFVGGRKDYQCCSFCGRDKSEVEFLIGGMSACICNQCVEDSRDIIGAERIRKRNKADAAG